MSSKRTISIDVSGCDDNTGFLVDLTYEQFKLVRMIAALTRRNSEYGCQPIVTARECQP